jgi:Holliday junction resolvase-like predicted endonuclease
LRHRWKTPFAEVDLVLRSPEGFMCLVEVKTLGNWDHFGHRVSARQRLRLKRAQAWLAEKQNGCLLMLAVVMGEHEVLVFDDVFS